MWSTDQAWKKFSSHGLYLLKQEKNGNKSQWHSNSHWFQGFEAFVVSHAPDIGPTALWSDVPWTSTRLPDVAIPLLHSANEPTTLTGWSEPCPTTTDGGILRLSCNYLVYLDLLFKAFVPGKSMFFILRNLQNIRID